ncbi:MAG TPA: pitrilysin family protein, partial [Bryobacteraceae bacterium]|nr:pitrilysin family protein [Bryobacteraceae bacterium]
APDRTKVPEAPDYLSMLKNYKSSLTLSEGEAFDPTPANIEKHLVRSQLPTGLKIVTLSKDTRGGSVSAVVDLRFGDEKSLAGKSAIAGVAGSLLMRGTQHKNRQEIQDEMVKLNARISVNGGLSGATASIQTTAANLVPALKLAAEILKEPSFPDAEFDQVIKRRIAGLEEQKTDPAGLARLALERSLNIYPKTDVRYVPTIDEEIADLKAVTLDDVKKFHAQFYGASHGQLAVVGQFDANELRKAAGEVFGTWKSPAAYARIIETFSKTKPVNLKIETPDKQNATFEAGLNLALSDKDPDYPAMVMANYMFGGTITARAPDRIRNKEGLSYGIGTRFMAPANGNLAMFSGNAISNPKASPKVESSFTDELAKTVANGFTDAELAAAKKAFLEERRVGRSQDGQLTGLLATRADQDRTMKWDEDMDARFGALTVDQVNAALKRHVDVSALSIVKAGDFKAAGVY